VSLQEISLRRQASSARRHEPIEGEIVPGAVGSGADAACFADRADVNRCPEPRWFATRFGHLGGAAKLRAWTHLSDADAKAFSDYIKRTAERDREP
jgi:hypothetical protein